MESIKNQLISQDLKCNISIKPENNKLEDNFVKLAFGDNSLKEDKSSETFFLHNTDGTTSLKRKLENDVELTQYFDINKKLTKESYTEKNTTINKLFSDDGEISSIIVNSSNPESKTNEKLTYKSLEDFYNQKPSELLLNEGLPNQVKINYSYEKNLIKELRKYNDKTETLETGFADDGKTIKYTSFKLENDKGKFSEFNEFSDDGALQLKRCSAEISGSGKKTIDEYTYQPDGKTLKSESTTEKYKDRTTTEKKEYQQDGKTLHSQTSSVEEGGRKTTDYKEYQPDGKTLKFESHSNEENGVLTEQTKTYQKDGKTLKSETISVTKDGETTTTVVKYGSDGKTVESKKTTVKKEGANESPKTEGNGGVNKNPENQKTPNDKIGDSLNTIREKLANNPEKELILNYLLEKFEKLQTKFSGKNLDSFLTNAINKIFVDSKTIPRSISMEVFAKEFEKNEKTFLASQTIPNTNTAVEHGQNVSTNIGGSEIVENPQANIKQELNSPENTTLSETIKQDSKQIIHKKESISESVSQKTDVDSDELKTEQKEAAKLNSSADSLKTVNKLIDKMDTNPNIQPKTKENIVFYYNHVIIPYAEKYGISREQIDKAFLEELGDTLAELDALEPETFVERFENSFNKQLALSAHKKDLDNILESKQSKDIDVGKVKELLSDNLIEEVIKDSELVKSDKYSIKTLNKSLLTFDEEAISEISAGKLPKEEIEKLIKFLALYSNDSLKDKKLQEFVGATLVANKYSSEKIITDYDNDKLERNSISFENNEI